MCNKLIVEDIIQELFQNEITTQNVAKGKFSMIVNSPITNFQTLENFGKIYWI